MGINRKKSLTKRFKNKKVTIEYHFGKITLIKLNNWKKSVKNPLGKKYKELFYKRGKKRGGRWGDNGERGGWV